MNQEFQGVPTQPLSMTPLMEHIGMRTKIVENYHYFSPKEIPRSVEVQPKHTKAQGKNQGNVLTQQNLGVAMTTMR